MKLKLIYKLLIALFTCTALVLVLITLITRASIDRGFIEFLQHQQRNQVEQLVPELANWYRDNQGWDELVADPHLFRRMVSVALPRGSERPVPDGRGSERRGSEGRPDGRRGPGPGPGPGSRQPGFRGGSGPGEWDGLPQRVFLLDAGKSSLIGQAPAELDQGNLLAIDVDEIIVGWLGVALPRSIELPEEEAFIKQQRDYLLIGLVIGLAVAALLAWLLARHLSQPVNQVATGIRALAAGNFNTRLDIRGSDEIARLGDDVNRLSSALSEHETVRKRWMSDIAHELRTPLAIISGELEALVDGVRPMDTEQLGSLQEEVKYLATIIDDLHNLALTDSGALAYKMQTVDLNELVPLVVDSFQGAAVQKTLELEFSGPDRKICVQGDEKRLRQLLHNLLDNAVRYTDADGRITINLETHNQQAILIVSDTVPGVSEEDCERLFERLYRLEVSRNRNSGGSGLGLAICRNIVEAHGGQIRAEPGQLGGLLITTTLPLES